MLEKDKSELTLLLLISARELFLKLLVITATPPVPAVLVNDSWCIFSRKTINFTV